MPGQLTENPMYVIPAIDLMDGKCVRLIQGQYHRQIVYGDDPVAQAEQFHSDGARWLHVVDLDGAKQGRPVNTATIAAIAGLAKLKVEVGGGLRDETSIRQLLDAGVERVIIGTKAVRDFAWFARMAEQFRGRVVLGLDARGDVVATHGWLEESDLLVLDFAKKAAALPLAAIIYTDITRDGMLTGPNVQMTAAIAAAVKIPVVASGGVGNADHVRLLAAAKTIEAVIAGRSLYEGTLTLAAAIAAAAAAGGAESEGEKVGR
jgi:phosphoribosylformimino-5-aminoimidazole carboxamide ribotide isomerase